MPMPQQRAQAGVLSNFGIAFDQFSFLMIFGS
jgi:hypothetical protein